jgi:hypothetical protein
MDMPKIRRPIRPLAPGAALVSTSALTTSRVALLATLGIAPLPTAAVAQNVPEVPTNVPGISLVMPPPATFDPVHASAATRAQYGVPPAPDAVAAPKAYQDWKASVMVPRSTEVPVVQQTDLFNRPNRRIATKGALSNGVISTTSGNWSGTSVVNGTFSTVEAIIGRFVVPTAHQAFGACTGGWDYSSQWPGIDGNGSSDVLQGGTEVDAYCNGSTTSSFYSAWTEWYPAGEVRVSSPAVHPGDLMQVEVWSVSTTSGYVYFTDFSTNTTAEYHLTAPSGTTLKGNSVEWIVERPGIGGGLATLTNYIDSAWPYGIAWNYQASPATYYYEGQNPSVGTLEEITMLDNNGAGISSAAVENADFLWFQDYGSACGRTGAPPC